MLHVRGYVQKAAKLAIFILVFSTFFHFVSTEAKEDEKNVENRGSVIVASSSFSDTADSNGAKPSEQDTAGSSNNAAVMEQQKLYQKLFKRKREAHFVAIDSILNLGKYEKQHKMINILLAKIFKVMSESQVKLMSFGFTPGDSFPTNESTREVFSNVLENTAFFGDMLLRLPDIVHDVMKKNREWDLLIKWGVGFCNMSNIFETKDLKLLNLMSQELGIIEKDENYVNPYKEENIMRSMQKKQEEEDLAKQLHKKTNKKKKDKKRGPRLSGEL